MKNILLIAAVRGLDLKESLTDFVIPGMSLLTLEDNPFAVNFVSEGFTKFFGGKIIKELTSLPCCFYKGTVEDLRQYIYFTNGQELLRQVKSNLDLYFDVLWLEKDNSFNIAHYIIEYDGRSTHDLRTFSLTSTGSGENTNSQITKDDNNIASPKYSLIKSLPGVRIEADGTFDEEIDLAPVKEETPSQILVNMDSRRDYEHERITRSLILLKLARSNSFLPLKISNYVIFIECLFSFDDNLELGHKIAERVSLFIGENNRERQDIFKHIKLIYGIRSSFVHGDKFKKTQKDYETLKALSILTDNYCRKLFSLVLQNVELFNGKTAQLEQYFLDLKYPIESGN